VSVRADARWLRKKYELLRTLRDAHERAKRDASFVEPDPRPTMARLADEWPGALRELDMLPRDEIDRRIARLAYAEREAKAQEPWMRVQVLFHRRLRGALLAKRWLAKRRDVGVIERSAFVRAMRTADKRDALAWADALERIASPPRGRVLDLVYARVATELGISESTARALVFERAKRGASD